MEKLDSLRSKAGPTGLDQNNQDTVNQLRKKQLQHELFESESWSHGRVAGSTMQLCENTSIQELRNVAVLLGPLRAVG